MKKKEPIETMTKEWLERRRSYLEKLKSQVALLSGGLSKELEDYAEDGRSLYKEVWDTTNRQEAVETLSKASMVLCGDFHSSPAAKRFYTKFFKEIVAASDRPVCIALECFNQEAQPDLDLWLQGVIQDSAFLDRIGWESGWGFGWEGYKKLILSLKKLGVSFRCINHQSKSIKRRDDGIADNLKEVWREGQLTLCLIGQMHLGPSHLPKKLESASKGRIKTHCVHLDPEEIYFTLGDYGLLDKVHELQRGANFAFVNTPPWVHWQSHLLFLDEFFEEDDEYEYEDELGRDYDEVVHDYVKLMCKDLDIDLEVPPLEVSLIDEYQIEGEVSAELFEIMQAMLESETSFYWPEQYEGIMVVHSLNHAAGVAGRYLHAYLMGIEKLPWGDEAAFNQWTWLEAVGYFLSKLINPKRSPINLQNLSAFLTARLGEKSSTQIMKLILNSTVLGAETGGKSLEFRPESWQSLAYASRLMGSLVGEALFKLYLEGGISTQTLRTYMSVPVTDKTKFDPFYKLVLGKIYEH